MREEFINNLSEIFGVWRTIKLAGTLEQEIERYNEQTEKFTDVRLDLTKAGLKLELVQHLLSHSYFFLQST